MKTPQLGLEQLLTAPNSPLQRSEDILHANLAGLDATQETRLSDSFRILRAILKSAIQAHMAPLMSSEPQSLARNGANQYVVTVTALIDLANQIEARYRGLASVLQEVDVTPEVLRAYHLTDESISIIVEEVLLQAHQLAATWLPAADAGVWQATLVERIKTETKHRQLQGFPSVLTKQTNEEYLLRVSALKKFTSSVLWLTTSTRREGTTLEHVLFATAAGVSMVFATLIAFYAQTIYGQFTAPVFLALVIAYMFKDRIKEQGRAFSTTLLSRRMFDYRTKIETHDQRRELGQLREKMAFVEPAQVPAPVMKLRTDTLQGDLDVPGNPESVIHYSKLVELRKDAFDYLSEDGLEITAINDIMRIDIRTFLRKMDDPFQEKLALRGDKVQYIRCHRTYHVNLISVFQTEDGAATYERTLLVLDRKGIRQIEQFDAQGAPVHGAAVPHLDEVSELDAQS
ncbi:MAG: hypothetical protein IPK16_08910 [Anaerolineales bacterium]|nr:hypothetical protein [Anaerolineales bacterium]